jgi:hypothetical protein
MRLGIFLQVLVQFQQLARGWLPRLFLQTLLSGNAISFYLTRGYVQAPLNLITSIPQIEEDPFASNHIHFVNDDFQRGEKTELTDYLVLHYVQGFVVTTFLDNNHPYFFLHKVAVHALPKDETSLMVRFPYNITGKHLEILV